MAAAPLLIVLAVALMLGLVNPIGYRGGGSDDWYYLEAARCVLAHHSLCLPTTHWATRLPIVLPMAAALGLFGDARTTLAALAFVHALAALSVFVLLVQHSFGRLEAGIAGASLAVTPIFAMNIAAINIDTVELAWALAALFCVQQAARRDDRRWAIASGLLLGVAIMARTTSILLLPIGALGLFLMPSLRRFAVPAAAGLLAVLALDALAYEMATGDPWRDWRLAIGHAHIPSTQISAPIGAHESPLFNRRLIAGWHRDMGIHVNWSIDGLLNLVASPLIGLALIAAAALLFVARRTAPRTLWLLAAVGACDALGLVYALAIDPEPRMFMASLCSAAAIIGVIGAGLWRRGAGWTISILLALGLSTIISLIMVHDSYRIAGATPTLAAWAAESPSKTAIDDTTRRAFPFEPAIAKLAVAPAPGRTRLLRLSNSGCDPAAAGWRLVRSAAVANDDGRLVAAMRARHMLFERGVMFSVCLFRRT